MNATSITVDGLWKNNPGLVQLIGLCPLLAVSNTVVNALSLGIATIFVLTLSNFFISALRKIIPRFLRLPIFIMIIATLVISASLLMEALSLSLYQKLGLFFALITTNCAVLARAEAFAYSQPIRYAILDGFIQGCGFFLVLLFLGALREIMGQGTLFHGISSVLGEQYRALELRLFHEDYQFLLMLLPPGAFLLLGFLVAAYHWIRQHDTTTSE